MGLGWGSALGDLLDHCCSFVVMLFGYTNRPLCLLYMEVLVWEAMAIKDG